MSLFSTEQLIPVGNRALVEVLDGEDDTKTAGGIIIPDAIQKKLPIGRVLSIGEGTWLESGTLVPVRVAVGDVVIYGRHAGNSYTIDGRDVVLLAETEIQAVIKDVDWK